MNFEIVELEKKGLLSQGADNDFMQDIMGSNAYRPSRETRVNIRYNLM